MLKQAVCNCLYGWLLVAVASCLPALTTAQTPVTGETHPLPPHRPHYAALTDLNGDGKSDLLYRNTSTGLIYRLVMDGLSIRDTGFVYYEPDRDWRVIADADFDGDGVSDLLWRNQRTGFLYMQFFGAAGVPVRGEVFWIEPDIYWEIIAILDFDGDGKADILWQHARTRELYAMRMDGARIVAQSWLPPPPGRFSGMASLVVGDFMGSGTRNQILWKDYSDGSINLMSIQFSSGVFWPFYDPQPIYVEPHGGWQIVAAADFDGDGKSDILWRNSISGEVWMMLMDGRTIAKQGLIYREPNTEWDIVSVGDYDGDGKSDILWRNWRTGEVWMMLMNGMAITSQGMVYTMPDASWQLLGSSKYARSGYFWGDPPPPPGP